MPKIIVDGGRCVRAMSHNQNQGGDNLRSQITSLYHGVIDHVMHMNSSALGFQYYWNRSVLPETPLPGMGVCCGEYYFPVPCLAVVIYGVQ